MGIISYWLPVRWPGSWSGMRRYIPEPGNSDVGLSAYDASSLSEADVHSESF